MEAASVKWPKLGFGMNQMISVLSHDLYVSSFPVDSSGQFFFICKTVTDTLKIKVLVCRREGLKIYFIPP